MVKNRQKHANVIKVCPLNENPTFKFFSTNEYVAFNLKIDTLNYISNGKKGFIFFGQNLETSSIV